MSYQTLSVLSSTPVWRICRAEDERTRQRRLIKELTDSVRGNEAWRRRLALEAQFFRGCTHPRFLTIHDSDNDDTLVLDDVQCTLQQLSEQLGPLPSDLIANILSDCAEGLDYLHSRGFAHGMLSMENVFVNGRGEIQFGDFLGYRFQSEKPVSDRGRKLKYQAPEVIDSHFGECGPWSDLYCLGFLAIELAAGAEFASLFGIAQPLPGQTPKWLSWHVNSELLLTGWTERVPQLVTGLAEVINGLIVKDAARRQFRTVAQLELRLKSLGQRSRRVLPMFNRNEVPKKNAAPFRPPARVIGPSLLMKPRKPDHEVQTFKPQNQVVVSSQRGSPLWIPGDEDVGKRHALLACQTSDWHVYDLYSPGGTFLNRQRVTRPTQLRRGDELRFGNTAFLVDLELAGTGIIPNFDLLQRIHVGEGGELYRAKYFRKSGKVATVALRILPSNFSLDRDQIRRFLRAIPTAGKLRHDNIVRLHRGGMVRKDQAIWYLASEYMSGGSLRDQLRKLSAPLPLSEVWRIGNDVGQALLAASRKGIVHRNINPSCILFNREGRVKLGDFTLMRGEVLETMYEITRGKLQIVDYEYSAPEVLCGTDTHSVKSDLYSLGVCLFEALTARLPIAPQESVAASILAMSRLDWPSPREFNSDVPAAWEDVLQVALARDPARRFATPQAFLDAINSLSPRGPKSL